MIDRNKELAINTVILGIGQLIPKFLLLITLPLLTSYLSTYEYGNYDLILSITSLIIPLVTMQIQQALFRYLISSNTLNEKKTYITNALIYLLFSSIISYPVVYLLLKIIGIDSHTASLICVLFLSEAFYFLVGQIVRGLGYNIKYSIGVVIYAALNLMVAAVSLIMLKSGLFGAISSLVIGYLGANVYMIFATGIFHFFSLEMFSVMHLKELLKFSIPIVPSSIALWIVNLSDRLVIIKYLGWSANGIYAAANKIPFLYSTVYNIFNLAWTETASRVLDDGNATEYYSRLFSRLFKFLIGTMLIIIAFTPMFFLLLVRGDYQKAFNHIPILYFAVFFSSLVNFYGGIYIALKRTKNVGYSSVIGAVINIIINILFIQRIGLYAASLSTVVSFMLIVIYRAYDLNKIIKIRYNYMEIILGIFCFVMSSICLFYNTYLTNIICWSGAVIYNVLYNSQIIVEIFKKFSKRILDKENI